MAQPRRLNSSVVPQIFGGLPDGRLVVALSGGADSAATAWAAIEGGRSVRCVHVHHARPGSDALERAGRAIAASLAVRIEVIHLESSDRFTETNARDQRYGVLLDAISDNEWLVTGHTADDVIETVLMNIARGSGIDGLSGIPAMRGRVLRPMLGVPRSKTRELAQLAGLAWIDDPDNTDLTVLRNRIRHGFLPTLEATFGPAALDGLLRTAQVAAIEMAYLDARAGEVIRGEMRLPDGGVSWPVGELLAAGPVLTARVVRSALRDRLNARSPANDVVRRVWSVVAGDAVRQDLVSGWSVRRVGPMVEIIRPTQRVAKPLVSVISPGVTNWGEWTFEGAVGGWPDVVPFSAQTTFIPLTSEDLPEVEVRARSANDYMEVAGRRRNVDDLLANARIDRTARDSWPVVVVDDRVVWIPGVRRLGSTKQANVHYLWIVAERAHS